MIYRTLFVMEQMWMPSFHVGSLWIM